MDIAKLADEVVMDGCCDQELNTSSESLIQSKFPTANTTGNHDWVTCSHLLSSESSCDNPSMLEINLKNNELEVVMWESVDAVVVEEGVLSCTGLNLV